MHSILLFGMPGMWEWVLIAAVLLIFFGSKKIPDFLGGLGKGIREFRNELKDPKKGIDDTGKEILVITFHSFSYNLYLKNTPILRRTHQK